MERREIYNDSFSNFHEISVFRYTSFFSMMRKMYVELAHQFIPDHVRNVCHTSSGLAAVVNARLLQLARSGLIVLIHFLEGCYISEWFSGDIFCASYSTSSQKEISSPKKPCYYQTI